MLDAVSMTRARIALLATGGTIAARPGETTGYQAGALAADALLSILGDAVDWADIRVEQVDNVASQTVGRGLWRRLARRVQALADSGTVDGIVITHGTDTLEETAYYLSLTVNVRIPVVLTGAMKPPHALGADGAANIYAGIAVASEPEAGGRDVMVVMNDTIHGARDVQKIAAAGLEAFASPNMGPWGWVQGRQVVLYGHTNEGTQKSNDGPLTLTDETDLYVPILFSHGDLDARTVDSLLDAHPDGVVLAGVGAGHTTDAALAALRRAAAQGVAVVRSTRCTAGWVGRNIEVDDDADGFIAAGNLNPQKARILLMLALQRVKDPVKLQGYFFTR